MMQQPRARDAGAAAAARAPPSGAPAASGCAAFAGGVVRPPAARRVRAVVPHTGAQGRRRPATCVCAFRPLRARACARSAPGHGRRRDTHTSRRRSSRSCPRAADPVCAPGAGRPSRVLSHTHSLLRVLPATCPSRACQTCRAEAGAKTSLFLLLLSPSPLCAFYVFVSPLCVFIHFLLHNHSIIYKIII
jgi:hypothetical protein